MDKNKIILIEAFKLHGHNEIRIWCGDRNIDFKFLNNLVKATPAEQTRLNKYEKLKDGKKVVFSKSLIFP